MTEATVGHTVTYTIEVDDDSGNPMQTPPAFDGPPTWTDVPTSPPVDSFVVAADGSQAVAQLLAAGADTISVSAMIGGVKYTASDLLTIDALPQKVGGIRLIATVS